MESQRRETKGHTAVVHLQGAFLRTESLAAQVTALLSRSESEAGFHRAFN